MQEVWYIIALVSFTLGSMMFHIAMHIWTQRKAPKHIVNYMRSDKGKRLLEDVSPMLWSAIKHLVLNTMNEAFRDMKKNLFMTEIGKKGNEAKARKREARDQAKEIWESVSPFIGQLVVDNKLPGWDNPMLAQFLAPKIAGKEMEFIQKMLASKAIPTDKIPPELGEILSSIDTIVPTNK